MTLTDEELAAASIASPPIIPRYKIYAEKGDWLNQKWSEMITG